MTSFCRRLLQQLAFSESCHFSRDKDPARTMAYCKAYHTQQYGPVNPTAKRHQAECNICGVSLAAGFHRSHLETQPDTYRSFVLNQELTVERDAVVYPATANATGTYVCPVPACVGVACTVLHQSCSPIALSLTPPQRSPVLPSGRVPSAATVQQMWVADFVCSHEWPPL